MTGYTYPVVEENINFREFALRCMRAFGALADRRDDDSDIVYTEAKRDTYHATRVEEAKAELQAWRGKTSDERHAWAQQMYLDDVASAEAYLVESRAKDAKIQKVLDDVEAWTAPTPEHVEYKRFMADQLSTSLSGEVYAKSALTIAKLRSVSEIKTAHTEALIRSVKYHEEHVQEEEARYVDRNGWIKAVVESLPA